jgi:hypothetical protein
MAGREPQGGSSDLQATVTQDTPFSPFLGCRGPSWLTGCSVSLGDVESQGNSFQGPSPTVHLQPCVLPSLTVADGMSATLWALKQEGGCY